LVTITVLGSFVIGITVRVPRLPVLGEGLIGDLFDLGPGGKGTNQAVGAARLGGKVNLIACVGNDLFAPIANELFEDEGISFDHIHRIPDINTAVGMVTVLPSGENSIVGHLGANLAMRPEHVDKAEDLIAQSDVVISQFEVPLDAMERGMELGQKHGALTILNPAPAQVVERKQLAHVDLITPNETETRILQGLAPDDPSPTAELAQRLLDFGVNQIVITRSQRGALIVTNDGTEEIPAPSIEAVDATGAGDSFNASLAVGLAEGLTLHDSVARANYAGAYCATKFGVIDGLPSRPNLDNFIATFKTS
tara:strand:- start:1015 stop:1941 length:927 start_codon:yes stop_codon:yes gene_type:complete